MKTIILALLFFTSALHSTSKHNLKIYYEKIENGYAIYADNGEFCPMSIQLDFTLKNLALTKKNASVYLVAPNKKRQLITKLIAIKKTKAYKFSYTYWTNYGNHLQESYDKEYRYNLPFKKGASFKVSQGYNGNRSHQNQNALDFSMPVGTEITSIREGIVTRVIEKK